MTLLNRLLPLMLATALPCGSAIAEVAPKCPKSDISLATTGEIVEAIRAYKGPDGTSKIETIQLDGKTHAYYGGKAILTQFDLGDPSKVMLVYGHPGIEIPPHASPYREIFIILAGSSVMELADGTRRDLKPGTMFFSDDAGSTSVRGGSAGPCGYVALDLQFTAPAMPVSRSPAQAAAAASVK
jgi:hypothetical protein